MKKYLQKNKIFVVFLFVVLLVHLVFLAGFHEIWWDSGVYVGMGKFLFSGGSAGLWEHIRPPVWPAVLGLLWFLGIGSAMLGLVLELLLSLGAVVLFYHITKYYFKEKVALVASAIFSFSSVFFYLSFQLYTEVPAVFFVLLSIYLFIRKRYYWSGFAVALAFLSKFPAGMFLGVLLLVLLLNKDIKSSLKLSAGFLIPVVPVLIAYQLMYGSALLPFIEARETILEVLGCNVLRFKPWWHYFYLIYSENILNLFAIAGLFAFFKDFKKNKLLPLLCLAVPLIYFSQLHCRDFRYLVLFIPFVAMFSGLGIVFLLDKIKQHKKQVFTLVLIVILGFSVFKGVAFYLDNETLVTNPAAEGYYQFLENKDVSGEIWSSNPVITVYTDAKIDKIYYPVYNAEVSSEFYEYLTKQTESIEYVFLDNCGGGIICGPDDSVCEEKTEDLRDFLDSNFEKVYDEEFGRCFYLIYKN
jgi:hypothetical protein